MPDPWFRKFNPILFDDLPNLADDAVSSMYRRLQREIEDGLLMLQRKHYTVEMLAEECENRGLITRDKY